MSFPNDVILVNGGDIRQGMWGIAKDLMSIGDHVIMLSELSGCSLVSDKHEAYQTGAGRLAGGILGAALLGPLGAAAGLLAGGKRRVDETIVHCSLFDGRSFTGEVSPLTNAKLQQTANRNLQNKKLAYLSEPVSQSLVDVEHGDVVECPMCAELIKVKAKVCRFCGYQIFEESNKRITSLMSDPTVETVFRISDSIAAFRAASDYESEISDNKIIEIVTCFSLLIKKNPEMNYRLLADAVKVELNIEFKMIINDIVREGFKFIRDGSQFDVVDNLIVLKKL